MAIGDRKDPYRGYNFLVEIDGIPNQRACQTLVREGMNVKIQEKTGGLNL